MTSAETPALLSPAAPTPLSPTSSHTKQLWTEYGTHSTTAQQSTHPKQHTQHNHFTTQQYTATRDKLRDVFNIFSPDDGDTIQVTDVGTVLRCMKQYVSTHELNTHILPALTKLDDPAATTTPLTHVRYDKLESTILHIIVDNMYAQPPISDLTSAFETFDVSGNGFLTVHQLTDILKSADDSSSGLTGEQLGELMRVMCDTDTQLIHYQDYVNATAQASS